MLNILDAKRHQQHRKLVRMHQWASELERFDVTFPARFLATYLAGPLVQHRDGTRHVFGYLKKYPDLVHPVNSHELPTEEGVEFEQNSEEDQKELFELLYPDVHEDVDPSFPQPYWDEPPFTYHVDSDWAGDKSNRRGR